MPEPLSRICEPRTRITSNVPSAREPSRRVVVYAEINLVECPVVAKYLAVPARVLKRPVHSALNVSQLVRVSNRIARSS